MLASHGSHLQGMDDAPMSDLILLGRCLWRRLETVAAPTAEDADFDALESTVPTESDCALAQFATELPGLLPPNASGQAGVKVAASLLSA